MMMMMMMMIAKMMIMMITPHNDGDIGNWDHGCLKLIKREKLKDKRKIDDAGHTRSLAPGLKRGGRGWKYADRWFGIEMGAILAGINRKEQICGVKTRLAFPPQKLFTSDELIFPSYTPLHSNTLLHSLTHSYTLPLSNSLTCSYTPLHSLICSLLHTIADLVVWKLRFIKISNGD